MKTRPDPTPSEGSMELTVLVLSRNAMHKIMFSGNARRQYLVSAVGFPLLLLLSTTVMEGYDLEPIPGYLSYMEVIHINYNNFASAALMLMSSKWSNLRGRTGVQNSQPLLLLSGPPKK
jgi:hypothetical protein